VAGLGGWLGYPGRPNAHHGRAPGRYRALAVAVVGAGMSNKNNASAGRAGGRNFHVQRQSNTLSFMQSPIDDIRDTRIARAHKVLQRSSTLANQKGSHVV
jgi:phage gp37-like protein